MGKKNTISAAQIYAENQSKRLANGSAARRERILSEGPGQFLAVMLVSTAESPATRHCWVVKRESLACDELLQEFNKMDSLSCLGLSTETSWLGKERSSALPDDVLAASREAGIQLSITAWKNQSQASAEPKKSGWVKLLERAGWRSSKPQQEKEIAPSLDRLSQTLDGLAQRGLAAGPIDLSEKWDGRFYGLDAVRACKSLIERWAMEEVSIPTLSQEGQSLRRPGPRL